ncbi:IS3 family transposase [Neisseria musculi]
MAAALHESIRYCNHNGIKLELKGLSPVPYRI